MRIRNYLFGLALGLGIAINSFDVKSQSLENVVEKEFLWNVGSEDLLTKSDVLITGFGPYMDINQDGKKDRNATQDLIKYFGSLGYSAKVLDVDYKKSVRGLRRAVRKLKPKLIISMGTSCSSYRINLSTFASNEYSFGPDNLKTRKIDKRRDGGLFLDSVLLDDISYIWSDEGVKFRFESSAGNQKCNRLFYEGEKIARKEGIKFIFLHLPYDIYSDSEKFSNIKKAVSSLTRRLDR